MNNVLTHNDTHHNYVPKHQQKNLVFERNNTSLPKGGYVRVQVADNQHLVFDPDKNQRHFLKIELPIFI